MSTAIANSKVYQQVMVVLQDQTQLGPERIREVVEKTVDFQRLLDPESIATIDIAAIVRQVESDLNVWVDRSVTLADPKGHEEWLRTIPEIEWKFWERYRRYLMTVKNYPPETVRKLDDVTGDILRYLEDPQRPGRWDRRGLVAGQVQSGKTANYTGLICKAVDAGYKLIVVLAGSHNSLRSQTQLRLDEGFLGYDTQKGRNLDQSDVLIGVGAMPGSPRLIVQSVTSSQENGDFSIGVARSVTNMFGGDPFLLVVKKNASVLKNVIRWATSIQQQKDAETGESVIDNVPLLVIDDEADNASINTRAVELGEDGRPDPDFDPTRINGQIRLLLKSFGQSAYVGYTATPFANIFINDDDRQTGKYGEDLFPRSFIVDIPAPSNYLGPVQVFGLKETGIDGVERQDGLPIVRTVDDFEAWMPDRHKQDHRPDSDRFPDSLREAIKAFVVACAERRARGQGHEHNSMLIHVTRYNRVQQIVSEQVGDYLAQIRDSIRYGDGAAEVSVVDELQGLWERDFAPTSKAIRELEGPAITWQDILGCLRTSTEKIQMRVINGTAKEALAYYDNRHEGVSVIAIGGDKLSRGLTLEGLTVSYYLRASKMYDTLMQMGRWFGYRPGYRDLCRLYTTDELNGWYQDITVASEELRREFAFMASQNATPADYGLRVRTHPDGLLVTAAAKMRDAETIKVSFSGTINETVMFELDPSITENNRNAGLSLLTTLQSEHEADGIRNGNGWIWRTADADEIVRFLRTYRTHPEARKARTDLLASYIEQRVRHGELVNWTVALMGGSEERQQWPALAPVNLVRRTQKNRSQHEYRIGRLLSPLDELIDLPEDVQKEIRDKAGTGTPSGEETRSRRPVSDGLLLLYPLMHPESPDNLPILGMAISFPVSASPNAAIDYKVNNVYYRQEFVDSWT